MPATNVTFDMVRKIGLALPGVEEGTMYGSPALKVHGRLLTCLAINKSAEPASLVVRTDFDERGALLAGEPSSLNSRCRVAHQRAHRLQHHEPNVRRLRGSLIQ